LARYTANSSGKYLSYSTSGGDEYISVASGVVIEGTQTAPAQRSREVVGGTYIQTGIAAAISELTNTANHANGSGVGRMPVIVLMTDGNPTYSTTNFTNPGSSNLGNGQASSTSAAQGFVTQLTAAYAKKTVEDFYGEDLLFYTLGFKVDEGSVAEAVLNPDTTSLESAPVAIDEFWETYNAAALGANVVVEEDGSWEWSWSEWDYVWVDNSKTVTKIDGLTQSYVTKYFSASNDLSAAFKDIIGETLLQSKYFPTLVAESEHLSGYVSFVDRVGRYMEVTDVKGILIHDDIFSGADLASNFVDDGSMGALGTMAQPTELGTKMLEAVKKRIGITDDDTARTLISLAYQYGQLAYTDAENFSNYIGWYANAKGEFLGFYHEGVTTLPAATGNAATDPAYIVKSYGYLGEVDAEHGVSKSDMMFAIVQVREDINSGEQMVSFGVPAALIPVVTYEIELDENDNLVDLKVSGATAPIRLVYEVALRGDIDPITVHELVDPAYIAANTENGKVNFYTNQYDVTNKTGYNTLNAYSYFNPSHQNERYYYIENAVVFADTNGTVYAGDANNAPDVNGTYYRAYTVYAKNGALKTKTVYEKISAVSLKKAKYDTANGNWYIPANAVHTNVDGYTIYKAPDNTNTLKDTAGINGIANEPFVDTTGWEQSNQPDEAAYNYYVGATLGNNGKIAVDLATGLKITKQVSEINDKAPDAEFEFVVTGPAAVAGQKYSARRILKDGTQKAETVAFGADNKAAVTLKDGEALYIVGIAEGSYKVAETVNEHYELVSINGDDTITEINAAVAANQLVAVEFANTARKTGTLTVTKEVEHNFGADYVVPDKDYSFKVKLEGIGTANKAFRAKLSGAANETTVTTNANGEVTFTLKNKQQLEIFDIPVGTVATVTETVPAGFTVAYWENGVADDGVVTITAANSVRVVNSYENYKPADVSIITIGGEKFFKNENGTNADWNGRTFTFKLEEWDGTSWNPVATTTASEAEKEFAFKNAFAGKAYPGAGVYYFRISEEIGSDNGVTYDRTVHAFTITVADPEMDGQLDVVAVTPQRDTVHVTKTTAGWDVKADFTNTYSVSGSATVSIDINKIVDAIGSTAGPEGFEFGLYDGSTLVYKSEKTTERGFARLVMTYNEQQQGLHTYTLKEIAPATIPDGWKYSSAEYTVTVNVFDNGAGGIDAVIYLGNNSAGAGDSITTSFTNTYDPEDENLYDPQTSTILIEANKTLVGRDMKDGEEFKFELTNESGTVVANGVVKDAKDGASTPIAFTEAYADALKLSAVGKYFYNLYETTQDGNGLVSDKTKYRIEVTVVDNNGKLEASYIIVNHADDAANFTNTYTAEKATHTVTASKVLNGKTLLDSEFEFTLTEADKNFAPVKNGKVYTTHNNADGSIVFETLEFNKIGEHYFVLEEVKGDEAYGIKYDTAKYNVKLTVTDNKDGKLVVNQEVINLPNASMVFTNEYDAAPTSVKIPGNKVLDGRVLDADDFTFVLYASNSSWAEVAELEKVKNLKDGSFNFTKFGTYDAESNSYIFDAATVEPYYYLIKEENGGKDIGGVLHDPRTYRVKIEIVDDLLGQHYAVTHIYNEHGTPVASVEFNNQYRIVDGDEVTFKGQKVLEGRELKENEFTFELFETADDYKVADGAAALQSKKNDDKGVITFDKIEYTKAGKYYYVIREVEDKSIERVTFDKTEYKIEVEVKDNLDGTATASYKLVDTTAKEINFKNVYTPKPQDIKVEIAAGKTVKNIGTEKIGAEGFEFVLEKDNDKLTAKSDKDGKIKFELDFTELDIDKTYTYSLYEVDGGKENVTYSKVKYTVTVAITLNDKNVLEAEVKVDGEDKKAEFENVYDYTPKTPEPDEDPKPDNDTVVDENPRPDYKPETDQNLTPEKAPNTGDSNKAYTWLLIFILSGGAALVLFPRKKQSEVK
ncbi:MAG: LPXTG cell wall anchor domain-containing protein, partial [Oscillospiraceae bacterium]|nr:LPXTG cell wall anchor domain-containing protein [Oscillospiraceae bacterium]